MKPKKKRRIVQIATAFLLAALLLPNVPSQAAVEVNPTIRIGLFFGSSALPGANLLNDVGTGYQFGYFDANKNFIQLGSTSQTAISMVKTQTVWYQQGGQYTDSAGSGVAVGCYHLLLPGVYSDFFSAQAAASQYSGGFPAWIDGSYQVRVGAYLDSGSAQAAQYSLGLTGAQIVGTSGSGISVVETGTSRILFQFDSTSGIPLAVKPGLDDFTKAQTVFRNKRYYGAFEYRRSGGNLTVINVLPMEDYVQGVVPSEMVATWPVEALKAQAVCARTYGYWHMLKRKHSSEGFDLCNGVHCQAYGGIAEMTANSQQAVDETYGQYLWYQGSLTEPVYFNCDGGATESAVNVWTEDSGYLVGKLDPYEAAVADQIEKYYWTVSFTRQELTNRLNAAGYSNSGIVDFQITQTSPTGNVIAITFTDSTGKSYTRTKEACRTLLGLRSQRYTVSSGSGGGNTGGNAGNTVYYVDAGDTLSSLNGAYAIDGGGNVGVIAPEAYAVTGSGAVSPVAGTQVAGSASTTPTTWTGSGDTFVVTGSGWGHHVGMSQWGANAMASAGYTYLDILQFYYTGIEVRQP